MKVRIIPFERADAGWHLALEEALFLRAKKDLVEGREIQPVVRMYSFEKPSVILGFMQRINEIDKEYCDEAGVRVTMRTTGGGSVYLGEQDVQYSLVIPQAYSKNLLRDVNARIINALQDVGFQPRLKMQDQHPVVRLNDRSLVFDAERRFKQLVLHHGTTLVDNYDYEHMPNALKASEAELNDLKTGNVWLRSIAQVKEQQFIHAFERNLPEGTSVVRKDFTSEEIKLAKKLYDEFYNNPQQFSQGQKKFGICYLHSTEYNMEKYATDDGE